MTYRFWTSAASAVIMSVIAQPVAAQVWEDLPQGTQSKTAAFPKTSKSESMEWARKLRTDTSSLKYLLNQAPHERFGTSAATIDLPLPDGGVATFLLTYSPIMEPKLAQTHPNIQTFSVVDVANSGNTGRLDITPLGFHAMFMHDGERVFIDPAETKETYYSYYESDYSVKEGQHDVDGSTCTAEDHETDAPFSQKSSTWNKAEKISFGSDIRRYRIAVAATGEYTQYFGGTKSDGQAAIVTAINRLNAIFESEMAIRLELVAQNESVVFTDPASDPFTHSDRSVLLGEVGDVLDTEIGNANYDIGHAFGVFGGGIAGLGVVCRGSKARGVSGTSRPDRSSFVRLLAHEVGHQFNASHTFNGSTGNCESNRSASSAVEPHSGSTIMSYGGTCGSENLSGGKDTFFHNRSLTAMNDFVSNPSRGGSCAALSSVSNTAPNVDAGEDGAIPAFTPFTLTGQASDADGDALTHIWEQLDLGPRNQGSEDFEDDGQRALFRSFQPSGTPSRTFPQLARVLAGDRVMGEVLPSQDRDLTFRITTRDGQGGVTDDERILRVSAAAGPFIMETPTAQTLSGGMAHTVEWEVANTTASPVNCLAVTLELSTDGGASFPVELAQATENDGSASVVIPNVTTTTARLKASCTTQPFFAINDANFAITPTVIVNEPPNANNDTASVEEDSRRVRIDVLANDSDPEGDTLTLTSVGSLSANGTAEIVNGAIEYTPEPGFTGTETFEYTVDDGNDNSSSAIATMTVTPKPNTAPNAAGDNVTVDQDSGTTLIDVLANDTDADGDTLSLQSVGAPSNGGSIQIDGDQIAYVPGTGISGTETFTYTVSDGNGATATATVTMTITAATPPPPPPPTTAPPPLPPASASSGESGGGGSFGPFLLVILAIRNIAAKRRKKRPSATQG